MPSPLANRQPGDIDFMIVRENTEGEYSSIGGKMFAGTEREIVVQETVMSRIGADRVFDLPLSWRKTGQRDILHPQRSRMVFRLPCPIGMSVLKKWPLLS